MGQGNIGRRAPVTKSKVSFMSFENVLKYQEEMAKRFRYRPLSGAQRNEAREFYKANLPEGFCLDGGDVAVYSPSGLKIAEGYSRIVIGDYGALVEILPEQVVHENVRVKPGQEYRDTNPKYSGSVTFSWLTAKDDSDIKIQFQKKTVGHTDMVPGRYYVSVLECAPGKVQELEVGGQESLRFTMDDVEGWLKIHGIYTPEMLEYFMEMSVVHGNAMANAVMHDEPPYVVEMWKCIDDVCSGMGRLTYEQYQAISYNLNVIGANGEELNGNLDGVKPEIRVAVTMGLEGFAMPFEIQNFSSDRIRELLRMSADELIILSKFSKVIAGHKAEMQEQVRDVGVLIDRAKDRVVVTTSRMEEKELQLV